MKLKLSKQALISLMMALQNSLQKQEDVVPVLANWDWAIYDTNDGSRVGTEEEGLELELHVLNPPVVEVLDDEDDFEEIEVEEL